ncbi:phage tail protein [Salmonella enterica]|nr:phage tail protein [Salmonella enterica]EDN7031526.1 phage tail protein [Salmonella enterica]EHM2603293.1 phage tail protein [Salmonella enterica subsp. enterica serovar Agona]EHM2670588.1 phage tail protein [Salmonella enterica subsp. enterica serovar Derby]EKC3796233.1 phage tail protein [Salmonella enterica subsp. enterica]
MTVKYYAILTNQGAARLANATMLGSKLNLTQMAVGDANGVLPTPDPAQTKLINQKRIAPLNLLSVDPNNQSQIIAEQIIPENEGGFWIREIGLYDDEGVLIAVANCPETYKPQLQEGSGRTQTIRMILVVTNTEAITLKIDPSVVLATRKYVDDKISEHEQSRRHPDASLTVKGFTQLSSAINSESETLAATPKAVKAAYDLANGKYTAQNATTTQKGIVQLSSATNSTSETLAATPKAVKAVMDETNKKAPLNSPALTGTPTTPTAPQGTNSTQIASTAFVMAAIAALVDSSPDALNTLNELAAALGNDPNFATTMLNALAGKQPLDNTLTNLSGKDVAGLLTYLGLEETINRAADALQKSQNGADIPDKPRFVQNIGLKETLNPTKRVSIGNIGTGVFDGSTPCINIGDSDSGFIGSADGVLDIYCNAAKVGYIDGNGLHMLTDIHFDNARMTTNGDIFGSVWGNNWLSIWITNQLNTRGTIDWINSELAVRDNNINTRATWDYVNQTFARKNTGSIQDWGWILDDSTGFIMQWGTLGNSNGTYNFPRAFPVGCFAVFVTNTNAQGTQVDNAFGYPVSNSQFFAATKSSGMANLVNNFPVAWLALGR